MTEIITTQKKNTFYGKKYVLTLLGTNYSQD